MSKKGEIGRIYGVKVAVEVNSDGSITLCKEIIGEINADKRVPEWVKKLLGYKTPPNQLIKERK